MPSALAYRKQGFGLNHNGINGEILSNASILISTFAATSRTFFPTATGTMLKAVYLSIRERTKRKKSLDVNSNSWLEIYQHK